MKHELLIFISTLPCCLLFAGVGIQMKQEPQAAQPNATVESTKDTSSPPQQEEINYQQPLFGGVKIQMSHEPATVQSGDRARNVRIHVTQNNSYHDIEVPFGSEVDEDSPAVQQKLHDLIFENSKQGAHSRAKCEYTEGKKCEGAKKVNDVDLTEEHGSRNKVIENFKRPDVITIPRGSEIFPHHHNNTDVETSSKMPLPEDELPYSKSIPVNTPPSLVDKIPTPAAEFPYNKSIPVNTPPSLVDKIPTPAEEFPYDKSIPVNTPPSLVDKIPTPAEEFPYNESIPVDKAPKNLFPLPATVSDESTTSKPTSNQWPTSDIKDEHQSRAALEAVLAVIFFGAFCSILYYFYAGNIRSCHRRQRQILIEEFDDEDGTRIEMNPRNQAGENNDNNEESAPL